MNFLGNIDNGTRNRLFKSGVDLDDHLDPGIFKCFLSLHYHAILEVLNFGKVLRYLIVFVYNANKYGPIFINILNITLRIT